MDSDQRLAVLIAVAQFLFFTAWVVYTTYLKDLLRLAGLDPGWFIWIIVADQLVFAVTDTLMGYAADRVERALGRIGPWLVGVNALSAVGFMLLPQVAAADHLPGRGTLLLVLIFLWVGTASVLRAPPLVLLMKYAAKPRVPGLAALVLVGLALGGAVSPYLGEILRGLDPRLPFALTGLSLIAATLPLVVLERRRQEEAFPAPAPEPTRPGRVFALLSGALVLALGMQLHTAFNVQPQYLRFAEAQHLVWLLPLFWVGFKLAVFPGAWAARRWGGDRLLMGAALVGAVALWGSLQAPNLELLILWHLLAGGAWGVIFMAGIGGALGMGRIGHEGLVLGLWFTMLSLAALIRIGLVAAGTPVKPQPPDWLAQGPWLLWLAGVPVLAYLVWRRRAS